MTTWPQVDDILKPDLASGVLHGRSRPGRPGGEVAHERAVGRLSAEPTSPATTLETVFDLAFHHQNPGHDSGPPAPGATGASPYLATLGELLLPPGSRPTNACLPLVSLLTHQSGLPAWKPFYATVLTLPADQRRRLSGETGRGRTPGTHPRPAHHLQRSGLHAPQSRGRNHCWSKPGRLLPPTSL